MIKLKDTLDEQLKEIYPKSSNQILMYVCGLTPYDDTHLGHARTFASIDILKRYLEYKGQKVFHIQNVTDIDDKIINRALQKNMLPLDLSSFYDQKSRQELLGLNILPPSFMPKVSESIPIILDFISKILQKGFGYVSKSGVYFDVLKYNKAFGSYGALSKQNLEKIKSGARIEPKEDKKDPSDFALWKFEEVKGATFFSPWGEGRPGWHIECSAMSMAATKGKPLDMHCGARDLIFPHHENEIAQAHAAGYIPFCYQWLHTGFLTVNGEKMAKSLGNFITLSEAMQKWKTPVLRLFFALSHYSSPLDFSINAIEGVEKTFENLKRSLFIAEQKFLKITPSTNYIRDFEQKIDQKIQEFDKFMENDLDTPLACSSLIAASKEISKAAESGLCPYSLISNKASKIKEHFNILGVEIPLPELKISKTEIEKLLEKRQEAREERDFEQADAIRTELQQKGIILEDTEHGTIWKYL
ncbi:MAG: cysteine--tRNA ligase [Candidatus Anstonellaceae archaeon]